MRQRPTLVAGLLLIGALLPLSGAVAQGTDADLSISSVDVSGHPEVAFDVSVPGYAGGALDADAFTVREDGERRQHAIGEADSGDLQVVLLIDSTGSMEGEPLDGAKEAGRSFVEDLPEEVSLAVVDFDAETRFLTDFSDARHDHLAAIDELEAGGRTATYDAVIEAVESFPDPEDATNQVVVLLTDGEDNESSSSVDDAVDALAEADVTLHSIEYLTEYSDEVLVRTLAGESGGSVNEADDADALAQVYDELTADLIGRYRVNYVSESEGAVELSVRVQHSDVDFTGTRTIELPDLPQLSEEEPVEDVDVGPSVSAPTINPPAEGLGRTALIVGLAAWFLALVLLVLAVLVPRESRANLAGLTTGNRGNQRGLAEMANRATLLAERGLESRGVRRGLAAALEKAGIALRPGEFAVLVACAGLTSLAVGRLLSGWLAGFLLAAVTVAASRIAVSIRISRRQTKFADQLGETLQLLSGGLRAGYSLMQAIDSVAREADAPAAEEFSRLVVETRLGRDMTEALHAMSERMESDDFQWVIQAIEIHREVGGDLAEVLDTVAGTIRERNQIRRQVKALSAEGRLSAYVLLALPFGVGLLIDISNREYLQELTQGGVLGWSLIGIGVALMTVGVVWMTKLVKLEF